MSAVNNAPPAPGLVERMEQEIEILTFKLALERARLAGAKRSLAELDTLLEALTLPEDWQKENG